MKAINIKLSRNLTEEDWSVEIDGNLYGHVSTETLDGLVEYALVAAQQNLLEGEPSTDRNETDTVFARSD
jgi:hypothetical protein